MRSTSLTLRQMLLVTSGVSPTRSTRASIQVSVEVEALDPLERTEHRGQEQLCVPLVPKATYWYQQAAPELLALAARKLEVRPGDES